MATSTINNQSKPIVRYGTTEATTESQYGSVTVYFNSDHSAAFTQAPTVTALMWSQTAAWRSMNIRLNGRATNYFTVQFYNASGAQLSNQSVKFDWIAVGY